MGALGLVILEDGRVPTYAHMHRLLKSLGIEQGWGTSYAVAGGLRDDFCRCTPDFELAWEECKVNSNAGVRNRDES